MWSFAEVPEAPAILYLIERACVDFHLCADSGFVVAERFQIDAQFSRVRRWRYRCEGLLEDRLSCVTTM